MHYFMNKPHDTITPKELNELIQKGEVALLDVRTPAEHAGKHVPGARLMPLDELSAESLRAAGGFAVEKPVYLLCQSGNRAKRAAEKLTAQGYARCVVVTGGTAAWEAAGLPLNRGESGVISLERQVRIAAGALALTGALLAHFVHPGFVALSGFVGAGLIFAGITDWCGMGMLLAKMPWNRGSGCGTSCSR